MEFHRGRLIDHVHLVVPDLAASRRFYDAVLDVMGVPIGNGDGFFFADEFFVSEGSPVTGRLHVAFQAADREMVDRSHAAGLAAGGRDNGPPGERRQYHPGYYAAFLLDPDGNKYRSGLSWPRQAKRGIGDHQGARIASRLAAGPHRA